jgi:hypothetical protein
VHRNSAMYVTNLWPWSCNLLQSKWKFIHAWFSQFSSRSWMLNKAKISWTLGMDGVVIGFQMVRKETKLWTFETVIGVVVVNLGAAWLGLWFFCLYMVRVLTIRLFEFPTKSVKLTFILKKQQKRLSLFR